MFHDYTNFYSNMLRDHQRGAVLANTEVLSREYLIVIIAGIITGTIARIVTLEVDNRQTPSYPNGLFINLVTGVIAATLGAVAIPALLQRDFVSITFLALALQHFRDIRKIEKESLVSLEQTEYTKRGEAYIDGISKTYEGRNYISLVTSVLTVLVMTLDPSLDIYIRLALGVVIGLAAAFYLKRFTKGKRIGDICTVKPGSFEIKGSELYVDGIFVTSVLGTEHSRQLFQRDGVALIIEPKTKELRITLDNYGQRQAMLFEASTALGVKRFRFTHRSFDTGKLIIALVPIVKDVDRIIEAVKNTPILENSRKIRRIMTSEGTANE